MASARPYDSQIQRIQLAVYAEQKALLAVVDIVAVVAFDVDALPARHSRTARFAEALFPTRRVSFTILAEQKRFCMNGKGVRAFRLDFCYRNRRARME